MKKIFQMAFISTTGMTLFSYLLSLVSNKRFFEPGRLNQFVFFRRKEDKTNHPLGYLIHYGIGTFFSTFYYLILKKSSYGPTSLSAAILGFLNGLAGISGWHLIFKLHPLPPKVKLKQFYLQLLAGHVIFGLLNGYELRQKSKESVPE